MIKKQPLKEKAPKGPKVKSNFIPTGDEVDTFEEGIIESRETPAGTHEFLVNTRWQGKQGDTKIVVYAGYNLNSPDQGMLIIEERKKQDGETTEYIKSPIDGKISITSGKNGSLTLSNSNGDHITFDVANKKFQ